MSGQAMVERSVHIGVFGKIPKRGDFISAGLPRSFMDKAENWMRQGLSDASQNPDWHEAYLSSPIWQFATARGVWDDNAWCGVVMPSVDSIGRCFPLLIAAQTDRISMDLLDDLQALAQKSLAADFDSVEEWKKEILSVNDEDEAITRRAFITPPMGGTFRALTPDYELIEEHRFMSLESDLFAKMIGPADDLMVGSLTS